MDNNRFPIQKLWQCRNCLIDMGLETDINGLPAFYIRTDKGEYISVTITRSQELIWVINWMKRLHTKVKIEFNDYEQFYNVVQKVFKAYCKQYGLTVGVDNQELKDRIKALGVSEKTVSKVANIGRSTVNDITRGITHRPRYYTLCRLYSAIYRLEADKRKQGL